MPNALELSLLVLLWGAVAWRTPSAMRTPSNRAVWLILFGLATSKTFAVPAVVEAVNGLAGGWQVASPLKRLMGLVSMAGTLTFVNSITGVEGDQELAQTRARRRGWTLAISGVLSTALWALQGRDAVGELAELRGSVPAARAYFAVFESTMAYAAIELIALSSRYRRQVRPSAFRTGISLIGAASVVGLVNATYNFTYLGLTLLDPQRWEDSYSLTAARWIVAPGLALLVAGMSVSAMAAWWQRTRDDRAYRALEPLWRALAEQFPQIVLPSPRASVYQRLHRRVIEIRDGLIHLREAEPAATLEQARDTVAAAAGLDGPALEDVAEACWIATALANVRAGGPDLPVGVERVRLRGGTTVPEEIALLSGVSRAFASSPHVQRCAVRTEMRDSAMRDGEPS